MSLRFSDVFKSLNYAYGIDTSHNNDSLAGKKGDMYENVSRGKDDDDKENSIPRDEDGNVGRTVDNECNDKVENVQITNHFVTTNRKWSKFSL